MFIHGVFYDRNAACMPGCSLHYVDAWIHSGVNANKGTLYSNEVGPAWHTTICRLHAVVCRLHTFLVGPGSKCIWPLFWKIWYVLFKHYIPLCTFDFVNTKSGSWVACDWRGPHLCEFWALLSFLFPLYGQTQDIWTWCSPQCSLEQLPVYHQYCERMNLRVFVSESVFICALSGILVANLAMATHRWRWKWWTKMEHSYLERWLRISATWVTSLLFEHATDVGLLSPISYEMWLLCCFETKLVVICFIVFPALQFLYRTRFSWHRLFMLSAV